MHILVMSADDHSSLPFLGRNHSIWFSNSIIL